MNLQDYQALINTLNQHSHEYYVLNKTTISDTQYDELYQKVLQFELANPLMIDSSSPTQRIGDVPLKL